MFRVSCIMIVAVCLPAGGAWALDMNSPVADSTKINVLRQYYTPQELAKLDGMNNVTQSSEGFFRLGAGDGGGWNDEANLGGEDVWVSHTWILPGPRVIGSWKIETSPSPATLIVEYMDAQGAWHTWNTNQAHQDFLEAYDDSGEVKYRLSSHNATFQETPVTAYGIRYRATNGQYNGVLRVNELQVFLAANQAVKYTDGFNILTQPGLVNTDAYWRSKTEGAWQAPNGGDATILYNGNVHHDSNELKNQTEGTRSYVGIELNDQAPMTSFTWGGTNGQGWTGLWEIYTCVGDFIDPANLGNTKDDLIEAGWTLQYQYTAYTDQGHATGSGFVPDFGDTSSDFLFLVPGFWENILIVWDGQFGAMRELEIHASGEILRQAGFGVPEPATMTLLALGGLSLLRRRKSMWMW